MGLALVAATAIGTRPAQRPAPAPAHDHGDHGAGHGAVVPAIDGVVLHVQADVDPAQVRLSVGADDGVARGQRFEISRDGQRVGEVEVEQVQADGCRCKQVAVEKGQTIQPGDKARSKAG